MLSLKKHIISIFSLFLTISIFFFIPCTHGASITEETFQRLDKIRETKKNQLFGYLEKIEKQASSIRTDNVMLTFFHIKNKYYQLQKTVSPPDSFLQELNLLKKNLLEHYIQHYLLFYDILFVEKNGDIFYTFRKQLYYHMNIFTGDLAKTKLAQQLKKNPYQNFVDYQYYAISKEPSAFFVIPVLREGQIEGWFILQCAINKINNMFIQEKGLGKTGEVFLVNKQNYMLTDSRFYKDSSILKKHLSHENITSKFNEKIGHKIITDYRGFKAFSSFEVCKVASIDWLLIAKIDEDEIITEQFLKNKQNFKLKIIEALKQENHTQCASASINETAIVYNKNEFIMVDMDEFRKVNKEEIIKTKGIATCTAVVVTLPGQFSYLAHISNLDKIYNGRTTDLLKQIFKRINTFDIYQYEKRKLKVIIIANHLDSVMNAINTLVEKGIFLSQIKFLYNGNAIYGNLRHDYMNNKTQVTWLMDRKTRAYTSQCASDVFNISDFLKPLIRYKR